MSEGLTETSSYEVGYGKPPVAHRFQPGKSGNSRGSSKKVRSRSQGDLGDHTQKALRKEVEIEENGRPVKITRLQLGIRKQIEAAAKGNLTAVRELIRLRDKKHPVVPAPRPKVVITLEEALVAGSVEQALGGPDTEIMREPAPGDEGVPPSAGKPLGTRKKPKAEECPARDLVEMEFERQIWVTDASTGARKRMTMREVIAEQLARLFATGKPGVNALLEKLNERATAPSLGPRVIVTVPHDFELPENHAPLYVN
jgi:hypothetical protein